ncbi:MAG: NADH-quinone oxidoreductase subunit C [Chloroflexi bacterium B3_Chlor]|nr:MAG: NADH-quinone oxidoreductase subunit C [Chloroflexi bacterium B3_Chlor]
MTAKETFDRLAAKFPQFPLGYLEGKDTAILVKGENLVGLAQHMRDDEEYDYCSSITGVDYPDRFEVVYHLYSTKKEGGPVILKVHAERENPMLPSVVSIWPTANWQEREVWDLMGIRFSGHPNLTRILMWEGFEGHPLRKDFPGSEDEYIFG